MPKFYMKENTMNKFLPILILILALSTGCALSITGEGLLLATGDSRITLSDEGTAVAGGSISEAAASLITNLAKLIPFTSNVPDVIVNIPDGEEE